MKYQITQFSLRGARRVNEDRVGYAERDNAVIMAVADGQSAITETIFENRFMHVN